MKELYTRTQTALDAKRRDQDALKLYWEYIHSEEESDILPEVYQCLYTAWTDELDEEALEFLIEFACHSALADVSTLALMARGEFRGNRDVNALRLYDRLLRFNALDTETLTQLKTVCFRYQPFDEFINLLLQQCLSHQSNDASLDDEAIIRFLFAQYTNHEKYTYAPFAPQVYQRLLEIEPGNLTARSLLCECYCRQEKYQQAIATGEEGLHYHRQHPDLLAVLAKAHYQIGELGKVVTYCRNVLAKRPGRGDIQVLLARVYTQNALTTNDAIKVYKLALNYVPEDIPIRQALLRSYLRKLMIDEAIAECEVIVNALYEQHDPESSDFRRSIKGMIEEYERAMRRSQGDITLYLITAKLHEYIGHFNKALIYYRTMLELPLNRNLIERLIEFLEKLATSKVQNPHLYLYLGILYHKTQRYEEAQLAFQTVMYSDLDDREVEDILIRYDKSIWRYPPVLVILAHHRIVTKDILEGLVQTFRQDDREDWNGALWVLQELYEVNDVIVELRQMFTWESFIEVYPYILPILANNGSSMALEVLSELLSHQQEQIRLHTLETLLQIEHPLVEQYISDASIDNVYVDVRLAIAQYLTRVQSEQTTYRLTNMLHDADRDVRLCVAQALQERDVPSEPLRKALFTEQEPDIRTEIVTMLARLQEPEEAPYLAHLFNDLVIKRHYEDSRNTGTAKVYQRLKKLIGHGDRQEDITMFSTLIQALGFLQCEEAISGLISVVMNDTSLVLRKDAIHALGQIGSSLGASPLQEFIHTSSEPQELRIAAEQALARIIEQNS